MKYRILDYNKDINEVVELIKNNLDPLYSEEIFLWKHLHNPFGKSIAMVAVLEDKIVGVVFYMRYNFKNKEGEVVKTIRPLDVCTEHSQRGKGVFKTLLKVCLESVKKYDLLFSTPNKKSYPEFIKLGWQSFIDQYYFNIGIISPLKLTKKILLKDFNSKTQIVENLNRHNHLVTADSWKFIKWRYQFGEYKIKQFIEKDVFNLIVYRLDKIKGLNTIILCDYIGNTSYINDAVRSISRLENINIIYYLKNDITCKINFIFIKKLRQAVIIYKENNYYYTGNICVSLGDLEGKL